MGHQTADSNRSRIPRAGRFIRLSIVPAAAATAAVVVGDDDDEATSLPFLLFVGTISLKKQNKREH